MDISAPSIREEFFLKPRCSRDDIMRLQDALGGTMSQEQVDSFAPLKHYFAPGLYIREIFIPAGTIIVGKIHRHAHFNDISSGRILVATEFGNCEYMGGSRFVSVPGTKRAVLAIEDTVWTTFHVTNKMSLAEIEAELICESFEEFDAIYRLEKAA